MKNFVIPSRRLKFLFSEMKKVTIVVVGDSMLDEYLWGDVERISPEAPVPVVAVESETYRLGGACNVVQNIKGLGASPMLISVCGNDSRGKKLKKMLEDAGCSSNGLVSSKSRITTAKTRIIARHQQVVRVDHEAPLTLTVKESSLLWKKFCFYIQRASGVILSDYAKGVIGPPFVQWILDWCRNRGIFIAVDPKERHFDLYRGVSIMTPNLREAHAMAGVPFRHCSNEEIRNLGWLLVDKLDLSYLLLTLSERGLALFEKSVRRFTHFPTVARKVFDVTGAGDTVISTYCVATAAGATPAEAAFLANHAAGLTVAELGTAWVTPQQLMEACLR